MVALQIHPRLKISQIEQALKTVFYNLDDLLISIPLILLHTLYPSSFPQSDYVLSGIKNLCIYFLV